MYGSKASMKLDMGNTSLIMKDLKVISTDKVEMSPGKFLTTIVLDWQGKQSVTIKIRDLDQKNL